MNDINYYICKLNFISNDIHTTLLIERKKKKHNNMIKDYILVLRHYLPIRYRNISKENFNSSNRL